MRLFLFILFFSTFQLFSQVVTVEERKIFLDGEEYRINGICYARGEGNGETSGFSYLDDIVTYLLVEDIFSYLVQNARNIPSFFH